MIMKRFRNTIILALAALAANTAMAFDFVQDGIYYNIQADGVEVTYKTLGECDNYSETVNIPATVSYLGTTYDVVSIGDYAFSGCVGLKQVSIPNTVNYIGVCAFAGCAWLESISIPASVTSIGLQAFNHCMNLQNMTVASGNAFYDSRNGCKGIVEKATSQLIAGCQKTIIPTSVTSVGAYAFVGDVKRNYITIPNSVDSIENYAFQECLSLNRITLGSSLKKIKDYAFINNIRLASVAIPNSVTHINDYAFSQCYNLEDVTFGNSLQEIGYSAFNGCESLTSLTIPASLNKIGGLAFAYCPSLESIKVESGNATYDSRNNCNAIIQKNGNMLLVGCKNTSISGTVKAIGDNAFAGASTMTNITIPASVNNIKYNAFIDCKNLTNVYSLITHFSDFEYGEGLFFGVPVPTSTLHVTYGTKMYYEQMDQWRDFNVVDNAVEPGDADGNFDVNVMDITRIIDLIMNGGYEVNADANCDGELDVRDLTVVIDRIMNGPDDYQAEFGLYSVNTVYRSMHTAGWSTTRSNTHQCFGISAYNLMAEVMGDDMIMAAAGSGWFWYDATYAVKNRYTSSGWRSYDLWNAYYTWIGNANRLISNESTMTSASAKYVLGQAYAIRAYSYFMLAQSFARTYKGHESEPCVPIYTGTSFAMNTGTSRATVAQVYQQIDADITKALQLLAGTTQQNPAHMGLAVVQGLKSRIALVKEDWSTALTAAEAAIAASGKTIAEVPSFMGLNDATAPNVMWGAMIDDDHAGAYASLFAHMSQSIAYGQRAPKQITASLYNKMSATDARRAWWDENAYSTQAYYGGIQQVKFEPKTYNNPYTGDYVWMRVEEMYLNAAEAACRLTNYTKARQYLTLLMAKRDPNYTCTKTGNTLGALTSDVTGSLLEEIITQRRIELWGEAGRVYDIKRLKQGFTRSNADGWPSNATLSSRPTTNPENYMWVLTIPLVEFNNNPNLNIDTDQNPLGDE